MPHKYIPCPLCGSRKKDSSECCARCREAIRAQDRERWQRENAPNPAGLCMCGCGQETPIWTGDSDRPKGFVKGQHTRYAKNHNGRILSGVQYVVDPETGCWNWQRHRNEHGYGTMWADGRMQLAHWVFYERKYGPIPEGMEPDHLCRNRGCVNPDHLEPITHAENVRRGLAGASRPFGPVATPG